MKKFIVALLACLSIGCVALGVSSCAVNKMPLAFNEEYLQEITLGEPIMLDEYIDPTLTDDYTAILTCDETGQERDLKQLVQWTTDKPGMYTLTYTVNSGAYKGKISTKINVVVAEADWAYSNPTLTYRAGETMSFNYLKRALNIAVESYYGYEFFVQEVTYGNKVEDLRGKTSYTFPEHGEYNFLFGIKTADGQVLEATHTISVRKQQVLEDGVAEWMEDNNISAYEYTYISSDGYVELDQGYCNGSYVKDNVPYIAFNGEEGTNGYGANTYVMTEFTGKNLPQIAFFCDDVKPSFTDGSKGVLLYNAMMRVGGSILPEPHPSRMTIFGPNKVSYGHFDNLGRFCAIGSTASPCPASWNALDEDCQYRYIAGIEKATATSMTVRILLINLTTSERVWDYTQKIDRWSGESGTELLNVDPETYYSGSIILYGNYGSDLVLDKVYMPIEGISDIYELDQAAEFKEGFETTYALGASANVSDYIDVTAGDYEFFVIDPYGEEVEIDSDGNFTFAKSGTYRFIYKPSDVNLRQSSTTVRVMYDMDAVFEADYFEGEGVIQSFQSSVLVVPNEKKDYINEGEKSLRYYTVNEISAENSLNVYIAKSFSDFVFMDRRVTGINFDIYSLQDLTFSLLPTTTDETNNAYLKEDYTGKIAKETWTTITLTRDLMMKNYYAYENKEFSIALSLYSALGFTATEAIYIDNIQMIVDRSEAEIATEAQTFMETNGITTYAVNSIDENMRISMQMGYYQGRPFYGTSLMKNDDVPYIAYNGAYGAGNYIVADFTGKNIPQICFFAKDVTSSLLDGKAGLYVHTGMIANGGDISTIYDAGRITFFGPNKIEYAHVDNQGRIGGQHGYKTKKDETTGETIVTEETSPMSINGLVEGTHYRYVAGIKEATAGKITLELLLLNLDTNEEVVHYTDTFTGDWITADYVSGGNIVMYGRYNVAITLDKIYAMYADVNDINAIDKVSEVLNANA